MAASSMLIYGRTTGSRQKLIIIYLVCIVLIRIPLSIDLLAITAADCCSTDTLGGLHLSNMVLSSTYLYIEQGVRKSLIYTKKSLGPDNVPCGTPPLGYPVCDTDSPILTVCWRSRINAAIHRTMCAGKSIATSLLINIS